MSNEKKVLDVLKNSAEPMRPGEIAVKADLSKDETDKVIQQLKKKDIIISPKRCFYSIK